MISRSIFAAILSSFFAFGLSATELKPWTGRQYSLDVNGSLMFQQFCKLDAKCGAIKRSEFDAFYHFSVLGTPSQDATVEIELLASSTRYRDLGVNALRATGRYFWLNDAVADPVSLATGITISKIFNASRHNVALFDHGGLACEAHVAIGMENSCEEFWTTRTWGVLGVGIADVGSPWLRANLVWERNWWEIHQLRVFADSIWGFGGDRLSLHPFHGYGSVNYQAIDAGVRYGFRLPNDALLSVSYAYRVFGRNCPLHVNFLKFEFCYPFGL